MAAADAFYLGADPDHPELQLPVGARARSVHSYVLGASGAGKSKMLLDWILQDVMAGRGCAVIDPKGDLVWDVLAALSSLDEAWWPSLARRLVLVDPSNPNLGVSLNPLAVQHGTTPARLRQEVFSIFRKIWGLDDARTPRLDLVLKRSLHLLIDAGATLADLPRLLTDTAYREALLAASSDAGLRLFWEQEFPASEAARFQWTAGILTRIEGFLDDPTVRTMFGSQRSSVDFRRAMDGGFAILVSLSRGRLGEESSALLGGVITAMIQLAAESRQHIWPPERRRRFYVYADEFHGYMVSSSLRELLAEGRGYGISLVIAHQNLSQLDAALRDSILANTTIRVCFRVNHQDAELLVHELFQVRGDRVKSRSLQFLRLGRLPVPIGFDTAYYSPAEETRLNRESLHRLPDRQFWVHLADTNEAVRLRTVEVPAFDRRIAGERIARFTALLGSRPQAADAGLQPGQTPRILPPAPAGTVYDWSPPRPRSPRILP